MKKLFKILLFTLVVVLLSTINVAKAQTNQEKSLASKGITQNILCKRLGINCTKPQPQKCDPNKDIELKVSELGATYVKLSWKKEDNKTYYLSTLPSVDNPNTNATKDNSITIKTLNPETYYSGIVKTICDKEGTESSENSAVRFRANHDVNNSNPSLPKPKSLIYTREGANINITWEQAVSTKEHTVLQILADGSGKVIGSSKNGTFAMKYTGEPLEIKIAYSTSIGSSSFSDQTLKIENTKACVPLLPVLDKLTVSADGKQLILTRTKQNILNKDLAIEYKIFKKNGTLYSYRKTTADEDLNYPVSFSSIEGYYIGVSHFCGSESSPYVYSNVASMPSTEKAVKETLKTEQEEIKTNDILISPNPATNDINILGDNIRAIEIYNLTGTKVYSSAAVKQINISSFAAGQYIAKIYLTNSQSKSIQFIKK